MGHKNTGGADVVVTWLRIPWSMISTELYELYVE